MAFIEERGGSNLGLGLPTGIATIIAAGKNKKSYFMQLFNAFLAVSIHTSRGFTGYHNSFCTFRTYRFFGRSVGIPALCLWTTACCLLTTVVVQCSRTMHLLHRKEDLFAVAAAELTLALGTLLLVVLHFRIDCKYDPD